MKEEIGRKKTNIRAAWHNGKMPGALCILCASPIMIPSWVICTSLQICQILLERKVLSTWNICIWYALLLPFYNLILSEMWNEWNTESVQYSVAQPPSTQKYEISCIWYICRDVKCKHFYFVTPRVSFGTDPHSFPNAMYQ